MFSADALLNPISADQPAGADLAFSPDLDAIAHARKFDDPSLDQGEWVTNLKEADWGFVVDRCAALIETTSKDLRLGVWLTEAATKEYGLPGLAQGLRVLAGMFERFWDVGLYPEAEDGDQEQRIGNLAWILSRIPPLLREIPVTDGNGRHWSLLDFDTARKQDTDGGKRLADMEASRRATSTGFRTAFAAAAQDCVDALLELERAADARLGNDAPAFVAARDAVANMRDLLPQAQTETGGAPVPTVPGSPNAGSDTSATTSGAPVVMTGPPGAIVTRAQAIAQLRDIADFFRRTEPHSPVSYFAEKAAKSGEQDLHTWLRSVVKDSSTLAHIEEMLGVPPGDE